MENMSKNQGLEAVTPESQTAPKKEKKGSKLLRQLVTGTMLALGFAHNADAQKTDRETDVGRISPTELTYYKNLKSNGQPLGSGVRITTIKGDDTVVSNLFQSNKNDTAVVELDEVYSEKKSGPGDASFGKTPIGIKVTPAKDTEKVYQYINSKLKDTMQFTRVSPGPNTPRKNAPEYLGRTDSEAVATLSAVQKTTNEKHETRKIGEGLTPAPILSFNTHRVPPESIFKTMPVNMSGLPHVVPENTAKETGSAKIQTAPAPKLYSSEYRPSLDDDESPRFEKQSLVLSNGIGPDLEEETGNASAFVKNNSQRYYSWLENRKWEHLTPEEWQEEQTRWKHVKSTIERTMSYTNIERGAHDNISLPPTFQAVDTAMGWDFETLKKNASVQ